MNEQNAIELIQSQIGGGRPYDGKSIPHRILATRPAYDRIKANVPELPDPENALSVDPVHGINTVYGIPIEVFGDSESLGKRAKELHGAGRGVLILDV